MKLEGIRPGDVIEVDKGGRRIFGLVEDVAQRELSYEPLTRGTTWRRAEAREVVGHWRKAGRRGRDDLLVAAANGRGSHAA